MFIGQANCSGKKNGQSIHELVKQVFIDAGMLDIYEKIMSASTDGASVMRSTRDFAGLDCRGTEGTSFAAFLKSELKGNIDFWHCLCHIFNLSVNDALNAIPALKLFWVPHVSKCSYNAVHHALSHPPRMFVFLQLRMMHSEFSKSSKRRANFEQVVKDLDEWDNDYDWKVFYPILFCITRWIGIQKCV